jgi:hypothetical protein
MRDCLCVADGSFGSEENFFALLLNATGGQSADKVFLYD